MPAAIVDLPSPDMQDVRPTTPVALINFAPLSDLVSALARLSKSRLMVRILSAYGDYQSSAAHSISGTGRTILGPLPSITGMAAPEGRGKPRNPFRLSLFGSS